MRLINLILLVFIIVFSGSCRKKDLGDCFKSAGDITEESRNSSDVYRIVLNDNVDLKIIPSNSNSILVRSGKNLLKKIKTEIDGDTLNISNENDCNWVRDFSIPVEVELKTTGFICLDYRSIGNVVCADTLRPDSLIVNVYEGAGEINLTTNTAFVKSAIHYGTADIFMSGIAGMSQVYSAGWGKIDNRNLRCRQTYVTNQSSNHIFVNATNTLGASIRGIGNIYYIGNPDISLDNPGGGSLIKLED